MMKTKIANSLLLLCSLFASGCSVPQPSMSARTNICQLFNEQPSWYKVMRKAEIKHQVPLALTASIIQQESSFQQSAKPPYSTYVLGIIPWQRASSAVGYAQAIDVTWQRYLDENNRSSWWASRESFSDSVDFVGWYVHDIMNRTHLPPTSPKQIYLAYHEGVGGYTRGSYKQKSELDAISTQVQNRAILYQKQWDACRQSVRARHPIFTLLHG